MFYFNLWKILIKYKNELTFALFKDVFDVKLDNRSFVINYPITDLWTDS